MKKNIHPQNYREVVFKDTSSNSMFLIKSTVNTDKSIEYEGKTYPLYNIDTSSASHSFYTGNRQMARSTGRVERFNRMYKSKK